MLSLIREVVRAEFSNVLTTILAVIMLVFLSKSAMEYIDNYLIDNERKHRIISKRIDNLDHAVYHLEEDVDELYDDSDSDTSSVDEKPDSDHVTV